MFHHDTAPYLQVWDLQVRCDGPGFCMQAAGRVGAAGLTFITVPPSDNPLRLSIELNGNLIGYRSDRRGDDRVMMRVDEAAHAVLVVSIGHRTDRPPH